LINFFKFIFLISQVIFFSNINAAEIDLNKPYYKLGWKNLIDSKSVTIKIPNANSTIEIIETEIYLDEKENIKKYSEFRTGQETNIEDISKSLIIADKDGFYSIDVEYNDGGYITSDRFKNFTSLDIIETFIKRKPDSISKISWVLEPKLSDKKISTYGYRIDWLDGDITYEYTSLVLGREGYIEIFLQLYGDGNESDDFFDYYSNLINGISSTVKFDDKYTYSDFKPDDYVSVNSLTNIIDRSYGMGISTDPNKYIAYCLVTTAALKNATIAKADYPRFAGKVIEFYISDIKKEILDVSEEEEVNTLSGMYGPADRQIFKKTDIRSNAFSLAYTNVIELQGKKEDDKVKYEYKNKLQFTNGKPIRFFADIDQTGFSFNKWNLKLNCRDYAYTEEEKQEAKKRESFFDKKKNLPEWFKPLTDKVIKEGRPKLDLNKTKPTTKEILPLNYTLFIEEDGTDYMIVFRYPDATLKGTIIYDPGSNYSKYFRDVYSNQSSLTKTFIQPMKLNSDAEMEDYMLPEYKLDEFNYRFLIKKDQYFLEFESKDGLERIISFLNSEKTFSISTTNDVVWHASTFKVLNNIDDFKLLAKKNPNTICKIWNEQLISNILNKELGTVKISEKLTNSGVNYKSLGCK